MVIQPGAACRSLRLLTLAGRIFGPVRARQYGATGQVREDSPGLQLRSRRPFHQLAGTPDGRHRPAQLLCHRVVVHARAFARADGALTADPPDRFRRFRRVRSRRSTAEGSRRAATGKVLPWHLVETPRIVNATVAQDDRSELGELAVPDLR